MSEYLLSNTLKLKVSDTSLLKTLNLINHDVLTLAEDQRVRLTNLSKAESLGKHSDLHTFITIKSNEGLFKFKLTVLRFDNNKVYTKEGFAIPLPSIFAVDFY